MFFVMLTLQIQNDGNVMLTGGRERKVKNDIL
jgi:hypothetical protein